MNDLDRRALLGAAGLVSVATLAGRAKSGPLDPPAGPVISTGKTIAEAEPRTPLTAAATPGDASSVFRIATPGSYYLTGNLVVASGLSGIKVGASGVTIDLNGFTISGAGAAAGISAESAALERIVVKNGHIIGASTGVSLSSNAGVRLEDLMVDGCTVDGVAVGLHSIVVRCRASRSGRYGFSYGNGAVFADCIARANGAGSTGAGFHAGGTSAVPIGSVTFTNCLAEANVHTGFHAFGPATLENCAATTNGTYGFNLNQGQSVLRGCVAQQNSTGFSVVGGLIENCVAAENTNTGINVTASCCTVRDCHVVNNTVYGILHTSSALIQRNTIVGTANSTAIHGGGSGCRIENNFISGATFGIVLIINPGNIVIGNTLSIVATPFQLPAGTVYGPIVDRTALGSPAVNGASAPGVIGTTDPFANIVA